MDTTTHTTETDKPQVAKPKAAWRKYTAPVLVLFALVLAGGGLWFFIDQSKYVYTDNAAVSAPLIQLTPTAAGVLKSVLIQEGDTLRAHQPVARVGEQMITTQVAGTAITVKQDIGANYNAGQSVVTMIQPDQLQIIAHLEEDKGLNDVHVGQDALFTIDAYGSTQFHGKVEEVADTSDSGDIVFDISDKREEQNYQIKIDYDHAANPPFQNGMSAKVWIIK